MRYIVQLLPEDGQRSHLDLIRFDLSRIIGRNKAVNYPTSHVTLVWSIEDVGFNEKINPEDLTKILLNCANFGVIDLEWKILHDASQHITLDIKDNPVLDELRQCLFTSIKHYATNNGLNKVVEKVQLQEWPHITLAQDINPEKYTEGMRFLQEKLNLPSRIRFNSLALLAKTEGQDYKIIETIELQ
jgi:ribosomal protein L7Ae-like RNA K-turn-binding protein